MAVLDINKLNYCYKEDLILKDFDLSIQKGEIYGLIGAPRSGKTTVVSLILGLLGAPENAIFILGEDYAKRRRDIPKITGCVVDIPYFHNFLTVWENFKFFDSKYHFGEERIIEVLKLIGLASVRNKKVRTLRLEQQKRLSIGLALYHNPDFLVFDDLFRDLKKQTKTQLYKVLLKLKKVGKTILLTNRGLADVENVCSTIGFLESGTLVLEGSVKEVKKYLRKDTNLKKEQVDLLHVRRFRVVPTSSC